MEPIVTDPPRHVGTRLPPGPVLDLELPAVRDSLRVVRVQAAQFLRGVLGAEQDDLAQDELLLALQEACTNVVRHAYPGQHGAGPLAVRVEVLPTLVRFTVEDEGPGFDLAGIQVPDRTQPKDGGYGLFLLRRLMTRLVYRRGRPRNALVLEKARGRPRTGAGP